MTEVTRILTAMENGDDSDSAKLLPLVYDELRRLAARELRDRPSGDSLQPTVLVHEAYLRLVGQDQTPCWSHRGHLYAAAAESMRRILGEQTRRRQTLKRGGDRIRFPLDDCQAAPQRHPDLVSLDLALEELAVQYPEISELVSLRYFAGLTMSQAAKAQGTALRTAERNWAFAKAWLLDAMEKDS